MLDVPGPTPADMLRDAPAMIRDPLRYLERVRTRFGPLVSFPLPNTPILFVDDPVHVRHILIENHKAWTKRTVQYDTLALLTGQGLLTNDPPTWMTHRRMVQPAFHHARLPRVVGYTAAAAATAAGELQASGENPVDLDAITMHATLGVVGAALFSTDLSGTASSLVAAVLTGLDQVVVRARSPWLPPLRVPTRGNVRMRRALRTLDDAVDIIVAQRRADPAGVGDDLLGLLLDGQRVATLDDRAVRDEIATILIAGHETVASALTWTFDLLGRHPEVRARLEDEVDAVVPAGGAPSWDDLKRLPYTRAVIDEALRLYPPAWVISRRAAAPDTLGNVEVPAGTVVLMSPWTLHRDPQRWPHPQTFNPDRWSGDVDRSAYLPFGAGPRLCIGRDFALVEAVVLLATLTRRLRFDPVGPPRRVDALVTLRPRGGLPVRVSVREGGARGR